MADRSRSPARAAPPSRGMSREEALQVSRNTPGGIGIRWVGARPLPDGPVPEWALQERSWVPVFDNDEDAAPPSQGMTWRDALRAPRSSGVRWIGARPLPPGPLPEWALDQRSWEPIVDNFNPGNLVPGDRVRTRFGGVLLEGTVTRFDGEFIWVDWPLEEMEVQWEDSIKVGHMH